jgi:tRNA uracil 4-sulfurtransferase
VNLLQYPTGTPLAVPAPRTILLRYHEVALKGANRGWFERMLAQNVRKLLKRALGPDAPVEVERRHSRIVVQAPWTPATQQALDRVFGIASYSVARPVATELDAIAAAALDELKLHVHDHGLPKSFRVSTRRSDKALGNSSMEIDRELGQRIQRVFPGLQVKLKGAEFTAGIEIREGTSFVWTRKIRGKGGLPVGTNSRLLALISGGLDSPVAALKVLRRGSPVAFLHFHGAPFVGEEVLEKVEDLVRIVNAYHPVPQPLFVVPFGKIQERIALATNPKLRTVLYRRMMFRIANRAAEVAHAEALVTGESLGQVASQTVENLAVIDEASTLPVLRPLIGFDKDEIIEEAQAWGTYEPSIRPAVDCCTLFADRYPAVRTQLPQLQAEESRFPVQEYVEEALSSMERRKVPAR